LEGKFQGISLSKGWNQAGGEQRKIIVYAIGFTPPLGKESREQAGAAAYV